MTSGLEVDPEDASTTQLLGLPGTTNGKFSYLLCLPAQSVGKMN